jgi:hypothetical protein
MSAGSMSSSGWAKKSTSFGLAVGGGIDGAGKAGASSSWSGAAIGGAWKGTTTPEVGRRREAVRCSSTQKIFC